MAEKDGGSYVNCSICAINEKCSRGDASVGIVRGSLGGEVICVSLAATSYMMISSSCGGVAIKHFICPEGLYINIHQIHPFHHMHVFLQYR